MNMAKKTAMVMRRLKSKLLTGMRKGMKMP
jgi:hypothetical protein